MTAQQMMAQRARNAPRRALADTAAEKTKSRERAEVPSKHRLMPAWQLVISAMLFVVVVAVKLTMPDVMERYRTQVLDLMGAQMDVEAVFSAVGQLAGDDARETAQEVYQAVFGVQTVEVSDHTVDRNAVVYSLTNTPARTDMLQQVLGFAYADPVEGELTSAFGYRDHPISDNEKFHYGLDISAEEGTIISAFADGEVTVVGESSELGKYVEITHADGYTTLYAHCSRITASSGQTVKLGDPIAEVGATGDATGNHLHFELHHENVYLNPIYYVTC